MMVILPSPKRRVLEKITNRLKMYNPIRTIGGYVGLLGMAAAFAFGSGGCGGPEDHSKEPEVEDAIVIDGEAIDVDAELGYDDD